MNYSLRNTPMQNFIHRRMELTFCPSADKDIPGIHRLVNAFNKEIGGYP
jgi:hypothetical protein